MQNVRPADRPPALAPDKHRFSHVFLGPLQLQKRVKIGGLKAQFGWLTGQSAVFHICTAVSKPREAWLLWYLLSNTKIYLIIIYSINISRYSIWSRRWNTEESHAKRWICEEMEYRGDGFESFFF